jgi:ArsR family transcriptional regulator
MDSVILSSLSNQTRLKLLVCLSQGEKNVSQLITKCDLSQSAVSQHLEKLRVAGLVNTRRQGKEIFYSLTNPKTAVVSKQLLAFLKEVS